MLQRALVPACRPPERQQQVPGLCHGVSSLKRALDARLHGRARVRIIALSLLSVEKKETRKR